MTDHRIPTERVQKYASVRADEDDVLDEDELGDSHHVTPSDEDDVSSDDGGELGRLNITNKKRRSRRRLRAPPMNQGG